MRAWLVAASVALAATGCVLDDLDYEGRPCPCADGWRCGPDMKCVRGEETDGATADAPRPDAPGTDAGAPRCSEGFLFCDGFEDGPTFLDPADGPWHVVSAPGGAVAQTTTDQRRSGQYALFARTVAAGGQAAAVSQGLGGVSEGELWARAWVYVPGGQEMDGVIALSVGNGITGWVHGVLGPDDRLAVWVGAEGAVETAPAPEARYRTDEWFCMRLRITVSDSVGFAALHLEGDAAVAATRSGVDALPDGDYESVIAGIGFSVPAQGPVELYVDDVAVHTSEIGCE